MQLLVHSHHSLPHERIKTFDFFEEKNFSSQKLKIKFVVVLKTLENRFHIAYFQVWRFLKVFQFSVKSNWKFQLPFPVTIAYF